MKLALYRVPRNPRKKTARRASRTTPSGKGRSTSRETLCLVSDPPHGARAQVLALLCEGLPNKLIARHLKISSGTVKVHISNIFRALNVSNRLQAVLIARCWELPREPALGEHAPQTTQAKSR